jgi:hypothetical protein
VGQLELTEASLDAGCQSFGEGRSVSRVMSVGHGEAFNVVPLDYKEQDRAMAFSGFLG